jgi:hypothetical protein
MSAAKWLRGCAAGIVLAAGPACASQWFSLAGRDAAREATVVEVDLASVRLREGSGEAVLRISHDARRVHQAGFGYRSFVATAQIDCHRGSVALVSAAYYSLPHAQGARLGNDSAGREAGMPARLDESIPPGARQALLKAACP